jgi:4-hydroxythreonine-4-phosphate dehydrogenase
MSGSLLAITIGDVAGIGPEVVVRALDSREFPEGAVPLVIGSLPVLRRAAALTGSSRRFRLIDAERCGAGLRTWATDVLADGETAVCDPCGAGAENAAPGAVSAAAGDAAFRCLIQAVELAQSGAVDAIVTAPLNKESLHLAGHHYPGHTEILAERCGVADFGMMLHLPEPALRPIRELLGRGTAGLAEVETDGVSIVHVTLHTSVASVPSLLTSEAVAEKIGLMDDFLRKAGSLRRAIGVCALNPHGGEHGLFGDEEQRVIEPAVSRCRGLLNVTGPLPVDTLVRRAVLGEFDGVVAMYHDQGHIPIKLIGFDAAVNITLGLPLIRTSPTHGTAFDRAWQKDRPATAAGMLEAIRMAEKMARRRI